MATHNIRAFPFGQPLKTLMIKCYNSVKENRCGMDEEVKTISYEDCANAMLYMWMEDILTDGEYNRIMDKLNAKKDSL